MPALEIQSPQPTRHLKRKASQLDSSLYQTTHDRPSKKINHHHCRTPSESIYDWLNDLSPPIRRSRSDSYLTSDYLRNHFSHSNDMRRSKTTQPPSIGRPPTPQSSRSDVPPFAAVQASASYERTVDRPDTPAQSFIVPPSTIEPQDDDKIAASRVASPRYRDDLENHGVYVDPYDLRRVPDAVKILARGIIEKTRTSPEPSADDLARIRAELAQVVQSDEGIVRDGFMATGLFKSPRTDKTVSGSNVPFNRQGLPHTHGCYLPPLPAPKPDLQYGYPRNSFSPHEAGVMINHRIEPYAKPSSAGYWPFFFVEFKAASRQGTHDVGENQNAGTGALCVNSVETLLEYVCKERPTERTIDSIVFSCVADSHYGTLWVHWQECRPDGNPTYVSTELQDYSWKHDPDRILGFRIAVRNIIDHGVDTRLPKIKGALTSLVGSLPAWNAADKLARSRSFNDGTSAGGSQDSRKRAKQG